jgi:hypothetical protein
MLGIKPLVDWCGAALIFEYLNLLEKLLRQLLGLRTAKSVFCKPKPFRIKPR